MCNEAVLQAILLQISQKAQETFGDALSNTILFGSYARGDFATDSDIDVMILVDMSAEELAVYRKEICMFSTDLDLEYDVFTSIKLQDLSTFEEWKDTLPFYRNVLSEGVLLSA